MKVNNRKKLYLLLTILWMGVIFYFSSCDGNKSSSQSNIIVKIISEIFNIENKELLSLIVRKIAHITEYFILSIFISLYLKCYKIKINKLLICTFLISYFYACTDEIHQMFTDNRGPTFIDTLIDSIGIIIWLVILKMKGIKNDKYSII